MSLNNAARINLSEMKFNFSTSSAIALKSVILPVSPEDLVVQVARAGLRALSGRFHDALEDDNDLELLGHHVRTTFIRVDRG